MLSNLNKQLTIDTTDVSIAKRTYVASLNCKNRKQYNRRKSTHCDRTNATILQPRIDPFSFRYAGGSLPTLPRDLGNRLLDIVKLDDYQEPYQALKYAPYYSYSTVVMEMKDMMLNNKGTNINHSGMRRSNAPTPISIRHVFAITHTRIYANAHIHSPRLLCQRRCTHIRPGNKAFALTAINTPFPSALAPPLLYHPQRCTRTVQLTRRTIMRYRNSARCLCSIRTRAPVAGRPSPAPPAIRTASSPRVRGPRRLRTRR